MKDRRAEILDIAESGEEIFAVIKDAVVTNGIAPQTYVDVFKYLSGDQMVYIPAKKCWRCGTKPVTDIYVLQVLGKTCQVIREYMLLSWDECIFAPWLPQSVWGNIEDAINSMESMDKLKEILDLAGQTMKTKAAEAPTPTPTKHIGSGKKDNSRNLEIDWDALEGDES